MVKKSTDSGEARKKLRPKGMKLKRLHRDVRQSREELQGLPPDKLPPASTSNAARQARSRLHITFPVDWQELHLKKIEGSQAEDKPHDKAGDSPG